MTGVDLASLVSVARQMMARVDGERVVFTTGSAPTGELVVVWEQSEVEARWDSIVGITEEGGDGMDGLPRVSLGG